MEDGGSKIEDGERGGPIPFESVPAPWFGRLCYLLFKFVDQFTPTGAG